MKSNEKYPALKIVSNIYRIVGYAIIVISIVAAIYFWDEGIKGYQTSYLIGMTLSVGLFGSLFAFTTAEGIQLFMDIEKNTREK